MKTLLYAWRIITRMKAYSAICILGLVISLAGTMTLVRYIHQELSVDHYLEDLDRLHLLGFNITNENIVRLDDNRNWNNDKDFIDPLSHPSVEVYSTIYVLPKGEVAYNKHHFPLRAVASDSIFLQLMPREAVAGSTTHIPPTGIVISEELAQRIFGNNNPMGQPLTFGGKQVTVTGVMKRTSTKNSFDYDAILSDNLHQEWTGLGVACFSLVRLHRAEDSDIINAWQKPQTPSWFNDNEGSYQLIPLKDNYFNSLLITYNAENMFIKGDKDSIRIISFVAVLLFLIGFLNYLNLYTVIMQKRGLEFGVKKVFGAGRWEFFKQLYVENFLLSVITILFVGMIIEITDKILVHSLGIPILNNAAFNTLLGIGMLFGFPLLATFYPYLRYLYKRPVSSMKGLRQGNNGILSRSFFMIIQYVISFCLIVVSVYFAKQLNAMLNADLGFRTENILRCVIIPENNEDAVSRSREEWEKKFAKEKADAARIIHALNTSPYVLHWVVDDFFWRTDDRTPYPSFKLAETDNELLDGIIGDLFASSFEMFDLEVVEGRAWNDSIDRFENYNLIINESAKRALGITDIHTDKIQTVRRLWYSTDVDCSGNPPFNIVGVIKDVRSGHLSKGTTPTIYTYNPNPVGYINAGIPFLIHYQEGKQQELIEMLSKLRNEVAGDGELEYSYLKDEIAKRYENDHRVVNIYLIFAGLAIAVSCLGLFGLSLFEIRLRYREIALRKVHGAHMDDIVKLVLKRYLVILGVSAFIAFPLAIWFIHQYMADYAFRTLLSWWIFVVALLVIASVSAIVLFWQVHKAANVNPAEVMKRE
jgi:ABC-type antimicrobial peptide transport system permease subunit